MQVQPLPTDVDPTDAGDLRLWAVQWPYLDAKTKSEITKTLAGEQRFSAMLNGETIEQEA